MKIFCSYGCDYTVKISSTKCIASKSNFICLQFESTKKDVIVLYFIMISALSLSVYFVPLKRVKCTISKKYLLISARREQCLTWSGASNNLDTVSFWRDLPPFHYPSPGSFEQGVQDCVQANSDFIDLAQVREGNLDFKYNHESKIRNEICNYSYFCFQSLNNFNTFF